MKSLISNNITIDVFCKNPIKILEASNNGSITVLKNNNPVFYAVTPVFFKKLFDLEYDSVYKNVKKKNINKKFSMHSKWMPDKDFIYQAALWGIILQKDVSQAELAAFISYWKAEGCFFYHIQWQQKLARSLQKSRSINYSSPKKRDITHIPTPDQIIPNGFRGE